MAKESTKASAKASAKRTRVPHVVPYVNVNKLMADYFSAACNNSGGDNARNLYSIYFYSRANEATGSSVWPIINQHIRYF